MSGLTIRVNGLSLDYERSDLKIKKQNNALRDSFKVAHTSYPLRVVNNDVAREVFGDLSIRSTTKKIQYPCEVLIGAAVFNGIIEIKKPSSGIFIEVDITFGSVLVALSDRKLWEFLPNVHIDGDNPDDVPYEDESDEEFGVQNLYVAQAAAYKEKVFPEVYYQYPDMRQLDRYEDLGADEDHRFFLKRINGRGYADPELITNTTAFADNEIIPFNRNVLSPQVFAMAPIVRAFDSLGYGCAGSFVEHPIFNLLLFTSFADQITRVKVLPPSTNYLITGDWAFQVLNNFAGFTNIFTYQRFRTIPYPSEVGAYKVVLFFDCLNVGVGGAGLRVRDGDNNEIGGIYSYGPEIFKQEYSFTVESDDLGKDLDFFYFSYNQIDPSSYSIKVVPDVEDVYLDDFHPTIDFKRYVPDWDVIEAVNNFKNLFNLDVYINDTERVVYMNFNEEQLLGDGWVGIGGRFRESGISTISQEHYTLGMANDEDGTLLINNEGAQLSDLVPSYTKELRTKFKVVPHSQGTAELSEALDDKKGEGLMIYNIANAPFIASSFAGVRLQMQGNDGLYENFWKVWLRYRLNASPLTLSGPLTNTDIVLIEKLQRFYMNNQKYIVDSLVIRDQGGLFLNVELNVETVAF